jgi:hypothetical protein
VLRSTIGSGIQFSSNLVFSHARDGSTLVSVTANGGGWGHGVGMCQRGARGMASAGYNYAQILSHYYTGITLHGAALEVAPTPLRPVAGGLVLTTADVTFAWHGAATYYEVQVRDLAGAIVRQSGWITGTTWTTAPLSLAGTYEWRVGAWFESGTTLYCAWQRFFAVDRIYRSHLPLVMRGS